MKAVSEAKILFKGKYGEVTAYDDDGGACVIGRRRQLAMEMARHIAALESQLSTATQQLAEVTAARDSERRRKEYFQRTAYALETTLQACSQRLNCETGPQVVAELDKVLQQLAEVVAERDRLRTWLDGEAGVLLIAREREEQIKKHGWSDAHDDSYTDGQLALAAYAYCLPESERPGATNASGVFIPSGWPWADHWWRPSPENRIRELAKAGALIAAEIDRLQRLATQPQGASDDE